MPIEHRQVGGRLKSFARNASASIGRIIVNSAIALVLPAYLTRHLPTSVYSAWVLILQMSAYVSVLDFGIQTAVSKFIAEHEAREDRVGSGESATAGVVMMLCAGVIGIAVSLVLAWKVPSLFSEMPPSLYHDVRISIFLIGVSLSVGLSAAAFSAIFVGLQRYQIPISIAIVSRLLYAAVIAVAVLFHSSLVVMSVAVAIVNIVTSLAQILAWRLWAHQIKVSMRSLRRKILGKMMTYCSVQTVWSLGSLLISGMDTTIVGHYAYSQTGYYSIGTTPNNLILLLVLAGLGPLMPAASALSVQRTSEGMGMILQRSMRYTMILLLMSGLPLIVFGRYLLTAWVGPVFAANSYSYMALLVIANIIRLVCAPYSTMVIATANQRMAVAAVFAEACANIVASVILARYFGAIGVAFGTLIGGAVGFAMHFTVSMPRTQKSFRIRRTDLFVGSVLRPAIIILPSLALLLFRWQIPEGKFGLGADLIWLVSTFAVMWRVALNANERVQVFSEIRRRWPGSTVATR